MRGEVRFWIRDDSELLARLVEAVPATWEWFDGQLNTPSELVKSGAAVWNTGIALDRFHSIHPTVKGRWDSVEKCESVADLYAILAEQKLPGFIWFNMAGYQDRTVTFEVAQRFAVAFTRKGYRGHLHFYHSDHDNYQYHNPARCSIHLNPLWIELEWEGKYGGSETDIAPILNVCRALGLVEYVGTLAD